MFSRSNRDNVLIRNRSYIFSSVFLQGRFNIAAKHHISVAEIYESELLDIHKVCGLFTSKYTF